MPRVQTDRAQGASVHSHSLDLPDGIIPAGEYRTSEDDGHSHAVLVPDQMAPDARAVYMTSQDGAGPHLHVVEVLAVHLVGDPFSDAAQDDPAPQAHQPDLRHAPGAAETKGGHEPDCPDPERKCPCPDGGFRHECCGRCKAGKAAGGAVETRRSSARLREVKQADRNGVPVGVVAGYIATWDPDLGGVFGVPDRFQRGAFTRSLGRHRSRRERPIRLKDHHGRTIGGFPIETVREDSTGLFGVGEINLETQQGREAFSLARQGVLTDFSIGYIPLRDRMDGTGPDRIRVIEEAEVVEGSIVDEPANPAARILEVKAVVPFQDLPLADRERDWDSGAAIGRVRAFTGSDDEPSASYRRAFLWFDSAAPELFTSYKLPIADVIEGRLTAVPRGIFAAAAVLRGGRGGVDLPAEDRAGVIRHVERYFAKLDEPSPFDVEERSFWATGDARTMTPRDLEGALVRCGAFSRGAARVLASRFTGHEEVPVEVRYDGTRLADILRDLREAAEATRSWRDSR